MNKTIKLLSLALLISATTNAQNIFIGLNHNKTLRFSGNRPKEAPTTRYNDEGIFFRLNTNKKWSFGGSINYYGKTSYHGPAIIFDGAQELVARRRRHEYLEFRYTIQYNITPKKLVKSGIKQHIGLQLANRNSLLTDKHYYIERNSLEYYKNPVHKIDYMGGISYTLSYQQKRLAAFCTTSVMISDKDFGLFVLNYANELDPASSLSINIGIGYDLF